MEANELRIGNFIQATESNCNFNKGFIKVDFDTFEKIRFYNGGVSLKEIKLDMQWMLNFNFKMVRTDKTTGCMVFSKDKIEFLLSNSGHVYFKRNVLIESVHRLQNLFFALTCKELNI